MTIAARLMEFAESAKEAELHARSALREARSNEDPLDRDTGSWTLSLEHAQQARSDAAALEKDLENLEESGKLGSAVARRLELMEARLMRYAESIASRRVGLAAVRRYSSLHRGCWEAHLIVRREENEEEGEALICPDCGWVGHEGCDPYLAKLLALPGGPGDYGDPTDPDEV